MKTMKFTALAGGVLILSIAGYIANLYPVPTSLPVEIKYLPTAYAAPSNAPVTPSGAKNSGNLVRPHPRDRRSGTRKLHGHSWQLGDRGCRRWTEGIGGRWPQVV